MSPPTSYQERTPWPGSKHLESFEWSGITSLGPSIAGSPEQIKYFKSNKNYCFLQTCCYCIGLLYCYYIEIMIFGYMITKNITTDTKLFLNWQNHETAKFSIDIYLHTELDHLHIFLKLRNTINFPVRLVHVKPAFTSVLETPSNNSTECGDPGIS